MADIIPFPTQVDAELDQRARLLMLVHPDLTYHDAVERERQEREWTQFQLNNFWPTTLLENDQ